jgi:hypothetical protein
LNFTGNAVTVTDDSGNDATVIEITQVPGDAATIAVGTVTTGAAGSSVIVTNVGTSSAAVFDFTIPRGDTGATGLTGPQGEQGIQGETGATGATGSVSAASALELIEQSSDPAAIASKTLVYAKTDHKLYQRIPDGTITQIGATGTTIASESLSGDRTLDDDDEDYLFLDPNGNNRSVVYGGRTKPIEIINNSVGTYALNLKETGGGATQQALVNSGSPKIKGVKIIPVGSDYKIIHTMGY